MFIHNKGEGADCNRGETREKIADDLNLVERAIEVERKVGKIIRQTDEKRKQAIERSLRVPDSSNETGRNLNHAGARFYAIKHILMTKRS